MNYNHPQFRDMAGRLAQLFESEEGERILRLITRLSDSQDGRGSLTEEKPVDKPEKLRVGAWEATNEGTERSFVRVNTGDPLVPLGQRAEDSSERFTPSRSAGG